jgi:hypothetical protein
MRRNYFMPPLLVMLVVFGCPSVGCERKETLMSPTERLVVSTTPDNHRPSKPPPPAPDPTDYIELFAPEASLVPPALDGIKGPEGISGTTIHFKVRYRFVLGKPAPGSRYELRVRGNPPGFSLNLYVSPTDLHSEGILERESIWIPEPRAISLEVFEQTANSGPYQSISSSITCQVKK